MTSPIWMPLFVGDYMADTIGLTNSEHGAYLLAMMMYWRKGEALGMGELKSVCQKDFDRVKEFFIWCDGKWHHKRIDKELSNADAKMVAAREKAMKGVEARRRMLQLPQRTVQAVTNGELKTSSKEAGRRAGKISESFSG